MNPLALVALLAVFMASLSASAQVSDPGGILDATDALLGNVPFERAFVVGDEIKFNSRECLSTCPRGSDVRALVEASPSGLSVNQYDATGREFSSDAISASDWDANHRNYLRVKANIPASYGYAIAIRDGASVACPAMIGVGPTDHCLRVRLGGKNRMGWSVELDYVIHARATGTGPAIAQILSYDQTDAGLVRRRLEYRVSEIHRAGRRH